MANCCNACSFVKTLMMNKKWILYLFFFLLLFAGFYVVLFREVDFSQSRLPVINTYIPSFHFTDQNGNIISEKDVAGKVYVANYFFTTCRGICPKMNANMRRIFDSFKDEPGFVILSHSCMPETDSVPLLKNYEQRMIGGTLKKNIDGIYRVEYDSSVAEAASANNKIWHFVTGDKASLYYLARKGYLIDSKMGDTTAKIEDQFIHTQFFSLVDKQGRVRGIYDGLKEEEVEKLIKDIPPLLKENYQSRSLK